MALIESDFITLEVDNQLYLVSFMGATQTIIYTRLDGSHSGRFHVRNGWIVSKHPADFILIDEIKLQLKLQRGKEILTMTMPHEFNEDLSDVIIVSELGSGWAAVHLTYTKEEDFGFWEPENTGVGRYATKEAAAVEAREWAENEGIRLSKELEL